MIRILDKVFHLRTNETSYIFMVNEAGLLEHVYYGKKLGKKDGSVNAFALRDRYDFVPGNSTVYDEANPSLSL